MGKVAKLSVGLAEEDVKQAMKRPFVMEEHEEYNCFANLVLLVKEVEARKKAGEDYNQQFIRISEEWFQHFRKDIAFDVKDVKLISIFRSTEDNGVAYNLIFGVKYKYAWPFGRLFAEASILWCQLREMILGRQSRDWLNNIK